MSELSPAHYSRWKIQPIEFIRANKLGFAEANIIKYVLRHDAKNGLEDLKKAKQYLEWMIEDCYGEGPDPCAVYENEGQIWDGLDEYRNSRVGYK